jgi:hypothetical protein
MPAKLPSLPGSPTVSVCNEERMVYPDLPASEYECISGYGNSKPFPVPVEKSEFINWDVPLPFELYPSGVLKVPVRELNSCTFVQIKNICGLHFSGSRISIQTSVPCQGQLSHIMLICPANGRQKIVEFILRVIQYNKDNEMLQ